MLCERRGVSIYFATPREEVVIAVTRKMCRLYTGRKSVATLVDFTIIAFHEFTFRTTGVTNWFIIIIITITITATAIIIIMIMIIIIITILCDRKVTLFT